MANKRNIIIPLGGLGVRFQEANYSQPKPLIKVFGKSIIEWVLDNIDITDVDGIYIPYHKSLRSYFFESNINKLYSSYPLHFYCLNQNTKGAADTVYQTLKYFKSVNEIDLSLPIISLDGDNFYTINIMNLWDNTNKVFVFNDYQSNPIYSYVKLKNEFGKDNKLIEHIKEKDKISNLACTGAYAFKTGNLLLHYCDKILTTNKHCDSPITINSEYYMSNMIQLMIENNELFTIEIIPEKSYNCLGTPLQVRLFTENYKLKIPTKRYCFDLDNTLVTYPEINNDYSTVKPIQNMINLVRMLYNEGNTIIIYTARRMKTHNGNIGKVMKDIGQITFDTLSNYNIPYHEIYFGKPQADFYIDDLGINSFHNVCKEIGYYQNSEKCRDFHSLLVDNLEVFRKEGNDLSGEIHYYHNIQEQFKNYFPSLINYDKHSKWYSMEKINGVVFSQLYVSQELKTHHLKKLLTTLNDIHSYKGIYQKGDPNVPIYDNYLNKLESRYSVEDYSIYPQSDKIFKELSNFLKQYQELDRGDLGMIHGDPVFTNILLDKYQIIKMIDMRGKLGNTLSIFGDINYDYAKVYQSLIGYDEILKEYLLPEIYKREMIHYFENYIIERYNKSRLIDIKMITKTLLFTLLPLHSDLIKCMNYYRLIASIEI